MQSPEEEEPGSPPQPGFDCLDVVVNLLLREFENDMRIDDEDGDDEDGDDEDGDDDDGDDDDNDDADDEDGYDEDDDDEDDDEHDTLDDVKNVQDDGVSRGALLWLKIAMLCVRNHFVRWDFFGKGHRVHVMCESSTFT